PSPMATHCTCFSRKFVTLSMTYPGGEVGVGSHGCLRHALRHAHGAPADAACAGAAGCSPGCCAWIPSSFLIDSGMNGAFHFRRYRISHGTVTFSIGVSPYM